MVDQVTHPKKGNHPFERDTYVGMETEFVDMPLEPYSGRAFPSPPSTKGLLEDVRKNQLLVFGGSQSMVDNFIKGLNILRLHAATR